MRIVLQAIFISILFTTVAYFVTIFYSFTYSDLIITLIITFTTALLVYLYAQRDQVMSSSNRQRRRPGYVETFLEGESNADGRETGSVKWFNVSKGFGFITRDKGDDIFVHFRSIRGQGHRFLSQGQRVQFSVTNGEKGLQAEDVVIARAH